MLYQKVNKKHCQSLSGAFLCFLLYLLTACGHPRVEPRFYQDASSSPCVTYQDQALKSVIRWKTLLNQRERAELASWCSGIGPPVVLSPASPPDTESSLDALTLISWNIHVGGADVSQFVTDLQQGRLPDTRAGEHFMLLLQEAFRADASVPSTIEEDTRRAAPIKATPASGERPDIVEIARRHNLHAYYVPSMRNGAQHEAAIPEDRGNAILSTLPLTSLLAVELPYERQRRVAIGASISGMTSDGENWELQVINVHLDNRSHWHRMFDSFGKARHRQAAAIMEAILGTTPTILGGDFNTWFKEDKEPAIQFLQQFFELPPASSSFKTLHPGFGLPERTTDYLFFRVPSIWTYDYTRLEQRYGSDHYPLIGRICMGESSSNTE